MSKFICTAELHNSAVVFKELNFQQYRQLLKCFLGDEVYPELIFSNINEILSELTDLNLKQIDNLSYLDYCLLLFNIRMTSIGGSVNLYIDDPDNKQIKIDLQIYNILDQINNKKLIELLSPEIDDNYSIEYKIPSIKEIMLLEQKKDIYTLYTFFLKTIKFSDLTINLEDFSYLDRENIVQQMPLKAMTALTKRTHNIVEYCNNINILQSIKSDFFNKELILTLDSEIIAFVIKLFFNTKLENVYEGMFALSKMANISCMFLNDCSPGEFYFFAKKLEEINSKNTSQINSNNNLPPINNADTYFNME
jgi:hypothetical protein